MAYAFEVAAVIPATPEEIFAAWMSSEEHSEMTGGAAEINPVVGGKFTAWDGYIWGTTLELESPRRIAQSWRTSQFADGEPDSKIEVRGHDIRVGVQQAVLEKITSASPLGRAGTVEEAAGAVLFFCSPMSDFVTGEVLMCSGGMHF